MSVPSSFWLDTPYTSRSSLHSREIGDLAVIGAGITGIASGIFMAEAGYPPIILEGETVASGASGRNAGFLIAGTAEYYSRTVESLGGQKASRLWQLSLQSHDQVEAWVERFGLKCDHQRHGSLVLAESETELEEITAAAEMLISDGFPADMVSREDLDAWGTCLSSFHGGYFAEPDGVINPVAFIRGLAGQLEEMGGRIYEHSPVHGIRETRDGTVLIETDRGEVESQRVLVATNGYVSGLHEMLAGKVEPVRGQMLATDPADTRLTVPCYANFGYDYFRQLSDNRLLVGGMRDSKPEAEKGYERKTTEPIQHELENYLKRLLDSHGIPNITHRWAGIMGFSVDGLPIVGRIPARSNVFTAAGFTGHGMSIAPKIADIAASLLVEGEHPDSSLFSIRRFLN